MQRTRDLPSRLDKALTFGGVKRRSFTGSIDQDRRPGNGWARTWRNGLVLVRLGARVTVGVLLALPAYFPGTYGHVMAMQQLWGGGEQRH